MPHSYFCKQENQANRGMKSTLACKSFDDNDDLEDKGSDSKFAFSHKIDM